MNGKNLFLNFNLEAIYEDANFNINDFDKVGITGVNGAGKTTLFKVILGEQKLDQGHITLNNKRIGYLPQEIVLEKDISVYEYLLSARPIKKLEQEISSLYEKTLIEADEKETNKILKEIGKKQEQLEYYDYYKSESILLNIIDKMQIDLDLLDMKVMNLSGGQKSKIAFAHLLYSNPEIMLLDEPTNHLDLETRDYIINYLKNYQGMVLIISHDLSFLNKITNKTMYIDKVSHKITVYEGNYDEFMKKYNLQKDLKEREIENQEKEAAKLREIVLLYSNSSGKRKRMAQDREKKLAKLEANMESHDKVYKRVKMNIKPIRDGSSIQLSVDNLNFSYDNKEEMYHNLSFLINNKERFLIVGENGVGKSTLLKLIVGELKPKKGIISLGNKTDLAYYAQEQEILDPEKTVLDNVKESCYSEKEIRTFLGSFLFNGDDVFKQVKVLSPGEKQEFVYVR